MLKIMDNRAVSILHKKRQTLTFYDVIEKEVFDTLLKSFRGLENAELLNQCSFDAKTENFGFVLFHLKCFSCLQFCMIYFFLLKVDQCGLVRYRLKSLTRALYMPARFACFPRAANV